MNGPSVIVLGIEQFGTAVPTTTLPTYNSILQHNTSANHICIYEAMSAPDDKSAVEELQYVQYQADKEEVYLPAIRQLISKDLSEPYSIYVYRYFLYQWGDLCFMVSPVLFPLLRGY